MRTLNQQKYDDWKAKNTDPYGARIFSYAEDLANLLEKEIEISGKSPEEVINTHADRFSHEADYDGITGFMYGAAISTLSACWIFGEPLRRWHNLKTQLGTEGEKANKEGGVLNPALLNINLESE